MLAEGGNVLKKLGKVSGLRDSNSEVGVYDICGGERKVGGGEGEIVLFAIEPRAQFTHTYVCDVPEIGADCHWFSSKGTATPY
jgi:hypothetical protein